jgi:hypothetical protein
MLKVLEGLSKLEEEGNYSRFINIVRNVNEILDVTGQND